MTLRTGAALVCLSFALTAGAQYVVPSPPVHTIHVSGSAEVKVVPDKIEIVVGVETIGPVLRTAKAENDAAVERVLAAAKKNGIEAAKIQTDFVNITPQYSDKPERPIVGYAVRKSMLIETSDLAGFEPLMSAVVDAGANHLHSIRFMTTQLRTHRDEARRMAARAAAEKAQLIAASLGRKLGPATNISETSDNWWSSYGSGWGGSWNNRQYQNMSVNAMSTSGEDGSGDGTFAPGRISVTASVSVMFALE
jgi:hypothetical protein